MTKANTVVLGLGLATLLPEMGTPAMTTAEADGIIIAGILFDAGATNSPCMLKVGPRRSKFRHTANPISLHDVFFRIGDAAPGRAAPTVCSWSTCRSFRHAPPAVIVPLLADTRLNLVPRLGIMLGRPTRTRCVA